MRRLPLVVLCGLLGCGDSLRPIRGHDAQIADTMVDGGVIDGAAIHDAPSADAIPPDATPDAAPDAAPNDAPTDAPPDASLEPCRDGIDNDGDGKVDYPSDPGCSSPTDNDELDDCPSGPNCPACGNGADDDGDGHVDYPADPNCPAAAAGDELCGERDSIAEVTSRQTFGTVAGAHDDVTLSCGTVGRPDLEFTVDLPAMRWLRLIDEDGVSDFAIRPANCGAEYTCSTYFLFATHAIASNLPAGRSIITVESNTGGDTAGFDLDGQIAAGGSCEHPLFEAGVIECEPGSSCSGMLGMRVCLAECADGLDNNGDGTIDFPGDPGCSSAADVEDTVCPGPLCPDCADGLDNDGDGLIDSEDPQCVTPSSWSESCNERDVVRVISAPVTLANNFGSHNDFNGQCSPWNGPEVMFALDLPDSEELGIQTNGTDFKNLVTLLDASCAAPVECFESENYFYFGHLAAGRYYFVFDTEDDNDLFNLDIRTFGTISRGGSCEGPLADSGSFHCATGMTCTGLPGMRTCQ